MNRDKTNDKIRYLARARASVFSGDIPKSSKGDGRVQRNKLISANTRRLHDNELRAVVSQKAMREQRTMFEQAAVIELYHNKKHTCHARETAGHLS